MKQNLAEDPRFLVTIAAIVKNEAAYIAEWLEYHGLIGVEHFYVYDNGSDDDLAGALRPYILDGRVTLLNWPEFPGQMSAYNHAVKVFGRDCRWMALLDIDEFLQVQGGGRLPAALDYHGADVDQILLPWVHFGGSGHVQKPTGLVIESYVHRTADAHRQPKAVVRPAAVRWAGVHHCETVAARTINGMGEPVPERWILTQPVDGPLRVNHYFTKSYEEFAAKIARGQADGGTGKTIADFTRFQTDVKDFSMAGWVEPVKRAIEKTANAHGQPANHAPGSAQSELTPSRSWNLIAYDALTHIDRELQALGGSITGRDSSLDHVLLCAADMPPGLVSFASEAIRKATAAAVLSGAWAKVPPARALDISIDSDMSGRPFAVCRVVCAEPATLLFRVEGEDIANKPWASERRMQLSRGSNFLALILSPRVMRTGKARISVEQSADEIELSAELFVFL